MSKDGRNVVNWMSEMAWKPITNNSGIQRNEISLIELAAHNSSIHNSFHQIQEIKFLSLIPAIDSFMNWLMDEKKVL